MALTPHQLYHLLNADINRCFDSFTTQYASDTGSVVTGNTVATPWISADSGFLAPAAAEALRLKTYVDAHDAAHARNATMRDCWLKLKLMGRTSSAVVDTLIKDQCNDRATA